jgi:hypothetical protein
MSFCSELPIDGGYGRYSFFQIVASGAQIAGQMRVAPIFRQPKYPNNPRLS